MTFTNKAAGEMAGRIRAALGPDAAPHWLGTFHGLAARQCAPVQKSHRCATTSTGKNQDYNVDQDRWAQSLIPIDDDPPGFIDQFVPCVAAVVDDVVEGFEDPIR